MKSKEQNIIYILTSIVFASSLHKLFIDSNLRYDIYLFYDYPSGRYLCNIINDLANLITTSTLLYLCKYLSSSLNQKKILNVFIALSIADLLDYILFFQQNSTIKILWLLATITLYTYKWKKK